MRREGLSLVVYARGSVWKVGRGGFEDLIVRFVPIFGLFILYYYYFRLCDILVVCMGLCGSVDVLLWFVASWWEVRSCDGVRSVARPSRNVGMGILSSVWYGTYCGKYRPSTTTGPHKTVHRYML